MGCLGKLLARLGGPGELSERPRKLSNFWAVLESFQSGVVQESFLSSHRERLGPRARAFWAAQETFLGRPVPIQDPFGVRLGSVRGDFGRLPVSISCHLLGVVTGSV